MLKGGCYCGRVRYVRGEPARFRSSAKATRSFCAQCGTQLTFEHDDFADEVDITTSSLDEPNALPPKEHVYTASKLDWISLSDALLQFRSSRGG